MDGKQEIPAGAVGVTEADVRADEGVSLRLVVFFYGALALVALLWRRWIDAPPLGTPGWDELGVGIVAGLGIVVLSQLWTRFSEAGARLSRFLAEAIGRPGLGAVLVMAGASGFAEELLFRGALQEHFGWGVATVAFAFAHFVPRAGIVVWAVFALLAGGLFGGLAIWTDSLWAPIAAHVTVNAVNLWWLSREGQGPEGLG